MKRLEIVIEHQRLDELVAILAQHATGYTVIPGVTGLGEHGFHQSEMVVLVTVVTADHLDGIIDAILPTLSERANIVLITDVAVLRAEHFIPEVRAATGRNRV